MGLKLTRFEFHLWQKVIFRLNHQKIENKFSFLKPFYKYTSSAAIQILIYAMHIKHARWLTFNTIFFISSSGDANSLILKSTSLLSCNNWHIQRPSMVSDNRLLSETLPNPEIYNLHKTSIINWKSIFKKNQKIWMLNAILTFFWWNWYKP